MTSPPAVLEVKVSAEWGANPLWITTDNDPIAKNLPPEMWAKYIPITPELTDAFNSWDLEFQRNFNPTDPLSSKFPTEEAEEKWETRGKELAKELAEALDPGVRVRYYKEVVQPGTTSRERNDD